MTGNDRTADTDAREINDKETQEKVHSRIHDIGLYRAYSTDRPHKLHELQGDSGRSGRDDNPYRRERRIHADDEGPQGTAQ